MLWKVKGRPLTIVGTIHRSIAPLDLGTELSALIAEAGQVAFESNLEYGLREVDLRFRHGSLSASVPQNLYASALSMWLRHGRQADDLDRLLPWAAAHQLLSMELEERGVLGLHGIDAQCWKLAKSLKKKIYFLDEPNASLSAFSKTPRHEQVFGLAGIAQRTEESVHRVLSLGATWSNQDLSALEHALTMWRSEQPVQASLVIDMRNQQWLNKLVALSRGPRPVVALVGALHMVGETSLPQLLRARGLDCEMTSGY